MPNTNASAAEVKVIEQMIEKAFGVPGVWTGSDVVHEMWNGKTMWLGGGHIVAIEHRQADCAYAWFYEDDAGKRRVKAVLGVPPVTSAAMAVCAGIVAETPNPSKPLTRSAPDLPDRGRCEKSAVGETRREQTPNLGGPRRGRG